MPNRKETQPGAVDDNATKRLKNNTKKKKDMLDQLDARFSTSAQRKPKKRIVYG